ncbi:STAS domain-containing protein [Caldinitratiruptor microaerophilus]|uniref:STAS domain-containing protein n=1 Tax=Caldinitratiruptor microaerophilus TaxID=671077 RepID=A0AA35CK26_9FIRM|nr:STAS domain-containing protein [Caldinitratiruptor microaerophilus]BDG60562.1 hypothetical protein caldi_16520 [Caldinitratiruptor microaerophilus]
MLRAIPYHPDDDSVRIRLEGELDMDTLPELIAVLDSVGEAARVVLDCEALDFIDSTGVGYLLRWGLRRKAEGRELQLINLKPDIWETLNVLGFFAVLAQ